MAIPLKNHPGVFIGSVVIILLLVWGFWPKPILIETTEVKQAPLTVSIEEDGRTRVIDRYVISSPVNGMACRMHLKVGAQVKKGQKLFGVTPLESQVLDSRSRAQAEAEVAAAQSALLAAQQQANAAKVSTLQAKTEYQRYKQLVKKGLVSQDVFDKSKTAWQMASANQRTVDFEVDVAKHNLHAEETTLEYSAANSGTNSANTKQEEVAILSPIDGQILKVNRQCDGPISTGEYLLEIADPSALEIEVDVLSADAVKIKPGMKVLFERWGGDAALEGIVKTIEPIGFTKVSALGVEEQRVWVIADFTSPIEQWQRLGDGYRVEAKFILWQEKQVLQVPSSALFRYQDGWAVFTVENETAQRQIVEPGQRNGLQVQILSGVNTGQKIINHPGDTIEDGVRVEERYQN